MRVLGIMGGTSLDGADTAIIDTDDDKAVISFGPVLLPSDDADALGLCGALDSHGLPLTFPQREYVA